MLPKDEHLGDITAATGIYFDFLLPLFLRTNIIKATVTSVVNRYTILLTKLIKIAQSVTAMGSFKVEVTKCKYKGDVLFYHYFCLDIPHHDTPGTRRQIVSTSMQRNRCSIVASMLMPIPGMGTIYFLRSEGNGAQFTGTQTSCADFKRLEYSIYSEVVYGFQA